MKRPTVLVTAAGAAGTIEILRALQAAERWDVVAVDPGEYAVGFAFAARSYRVPMGADPAFEGVAAAILRAERPDFVIPLVDEEIPIFHRLVPQLVPGGRILTPRAPFCDTMMDKWTGYRALAEAGIPVPRTWLGGDAGGAVYPAVVKPRSGRGSRGVAYLTGADDLAGYLAAAPLPAEAYVVQERVDGVEFTVSVTVPLGGPSALAVVPKEVVDKRGSTVVGITRHVPAIEEMCRELQARLRADGPFNVQLIVDAAGVPKVIEVNPRYSTTVALTMGAGIDEVQAVLRHAVGDDPGPLSFTPDLAMLRYTAQLYVPAADWPPNLRTAEAGAAAAGGVA